ncbi:potassium channel family protein [Marinospirillum perlucidum]|uniref:potassium channel family protein n=1 Tax=Marinospirillum perlucidum TaxID=1982602 RepID=UPI000DF483D7|nr:potassium channel family protein [Marinospirillum perlucidum]
MRWMKIFCLLSPTWLLADRFKKGCDRTRVIKTLNSVYLSIAVASMVLVLAFQAWGAWQPWVRLHQALPLIVVFLWGYFLLSRCNEIFWAFLMDAFDKLDAAQKSSSWLTPRQRVALSLKSYLELVINFALIYSLFPAQAAFWETRPPGSLLESLYFSGVTITTLGYGDLAPAHWALQLLTVYEVFCGFILLVVCFTVYSNLNRRTAI